MTQRYKASSTPVNNGSRSDVMIASEGRSITIECLFKPDSEKPRLIWLWKPEMGQQREIFMDFGWPVDNLDIQFTGRLSCPANFLAGNASLVISNITKQDSGTFCCKIQKYHDTLSHSVNLSVTEDTKDVRVVPSNADNGEDKVSSPPLLLLLLLSGLVLPIGSTILSAIITSSCKKEKDKELGTEGKENQSEECISDSTNGKDRKQLHLGEGMRKNQKNIDDASLQCAHSPSSKIS
uniref:Ig-like domain-containing protein n=1 Tax=Eptatretus burgeri TaxID=7764 RepID=A0A8C4Q8X9_EPTBU